MLQEVWDVIRAFLGYERDVGDVGAVQMALRAVLIYALTLALIRLGSKRFLSEATAFDVIVGIMLGSVMSRAINGSAPLLPTLLAGAVMVGLHWAIAALAFRTDWFGSIVKGDPVLLIKNGEIQHEGMRRTGLSIHDVEQALRLRAGHTDPSRVELAYLERNGTISVIPYQREPHAVELHVKDGVQTVRITFEA